MIMKAILLISILGVFASPNICAQSLPPSGKEASWMLINDTIVGQLVLTPDQRVRLQEMEKRYQTGYDDLLAQQDTLKEEDMRTKMHALSANRQKEIRSIMTPKQFDQWLAMQKRDDEMGTDKLK